MKVLALVSVLNIRISTSISFFSKDTSTFMPLILRSSSTNIRRYSFALFGCFSPRYTPMGNGLTLLPTMWHMIGQLQLTGDSVIFIIKFS